MFGKEKKKEKKSVKRFFFLLFSPPLPLEKKIYIHIVKNNNFCIVFYSILFYQKKKKVRTKKLHKGREEGTAFPKQKGCSQPTSRQTTLFFSPKTIFLLKHRDKHFHHCRRGLKIVCWKGFFSGQKKSKNCVACFMQRSNEDYFFSEPFLRFANEWCTHPNVIRKIIAGLYIIGAQ